MANFHPQVLIIGAGPTGLFCALELTRLGVPVRIVEKRTERNPWSRAIGIQARTLEVLAQSGLAEELVARGLQVRRAHLATGEGGPIAVELDRIRAQFPFLLLVPQSVTEEVLEAGLSRRGVTVERGVELRALSGQPGYAEALLASGPAEETVRTDWLIGCDGVHSAVRELLGIEFEGEDLQETFLLADTSLTTPWDAREPFIRLSEEGPLVLLPLPDGQWRLIAQVSSHTASGNPTEEEIRGILEARRREPLKLGRISWSSRFRVQRRIVENFVHGRVLLAGDAAHVHSPVGGQGMNLGLQDAHNLAWKLALVLRDLARPTLLESYHEERHDIAEDTIKWTTRATNIVTSSGAVGQARDFVIRLVAPTEVMQKRLSRLISQTDFDYDDSSLTSKSDVPWHGLDSGDYAGFLPVLAENEKRSLNHLITDHRHVLLALTEPGKAFRARIEEDFGQVVKLLSDAADGSLLLPNDPVSDAVLILLRPDGYIGGANRRAEIDWVARFFETCEIGTPKAGAPEE